MNFQISQRSNIFDGRVCTKSRYEIFERKNQKLTQKHMLQRLCILYVFQASVDLLEIYTHKKALTKNIYTHTHLKRTSKKTTAINQ